MIVVYVFAAGGFDELSALISRKRSISLSGNTSVRSARLGFSRPRRNKLEHRFLAHSQRPRCFLRVMRQPKLARLT